MPKITKDFLSAYNEALNATLIITQHNKALIDSDKLQVKITLLYLKRNNELLLKLIDGIRELGLTDGSLRKINCWKKPTLMLESAAISKLLLDYSEFDVENNIDMLSFYQNVFLNLKNEPFNEYYDYIHITMNFHKYVQILAMTMYGAGVFFGADLMKHNQDIVVLLLLCFIIPCACSCTAFISYDERLSDAEKASKEFQDFQQQNDFKSDGYSVSIDVIKDNFTHHNRFFSPNSLSDVVLDKVKNDDVKKHDPSTQGSNINTAFNFLKSKFS